MFSFEWLQRFFPDILNPEQLRTPAVSHVSTDSRKKQEHTLFIPLAGETFDAHDFAEQAIANGAIALFWERSKPVPSTVSEHAAVFLVDDTLEALQTLAAGYRQLVNPLVIGITGSNGKTTTKDLVSAVFKKYRRTHHTQGNLNNHIGMPLTILSMPRDTEVLIAEMGMNHAGEIELLSGIAKPDYAVITNIGESHIEHLGSREGIAQAKLEIATGLQPDGWLILDADEPLLDEARKRRNVLTCGFTGQSDVHIDQAEVSLSGTVFRIEGVGQFSIPLHGRHHAKNAAYAVALAQKNGISADEIQSGFEELAMTAMRFEWLKGSGNETIINDAYNASPTSMKGAIEVAAQIDGFRHKVLVLGDIFELGEHAEALHKSVAEAIAPQISALFTYGEAAKWISEASRVRNPDIPTCHFKDEASLIEALSPYRNEQSLLLFKASRGMKFEQIIQKLLPEER